MKLNDIVQRGRLNKWTAQNVLRHGGLKGMPKTAGTGDHREFTVPQAVRLAVAAKLVAGGIPLRDVAKVLRHCEQTAMFDRDSLQPYPSSDPRDNWEVEVWDERYVQVVRHKEAGVHSDNGFYAYAEDKMVDMFKDLMPPLSAFWIDLTQLAQNIDKEV